MYVGYIVGQRIQFGKHLLCHVGCPLVTTNMAIENHHWWENSRHWKMAVVHSKLLVITRLDKLHSFEAIHDFCIDDCVTSKASMSCSCLLCSKMLLAENMSSWPLLSDCGSRSIRYIYIYIHICVCVCIYDRSLMCVYVHIQLHTYMYIYDCRWFGGIWGQA